MGPAERAIERDDADPFGVGQWHPLDELRWYTNKRFQLDQARAEAELALLLINHCLPEDAISRLESALAALRKLQQHETRRAA